MMRLPALALLVGLGGPAIAEEFPACEVVVAWNHPNRHGILEHEIAHCNGWSRDHPGIVYLGKPPPEYRREYPGPLNVRRVSSNQSRQICREAGAAYGCAFGGLME